MREIILAKSGEMALKGLNRNTFESIVIKNMKRQLREFGKFSIRKAQSTIYIAPEGDGVDMDDVLGRLGQVFGIATLTKTACCEKDMAAICQTAVAYLGEVLKGSATFKVEAKRSDKKFPLQSPQIQQELGGVLLSAFPHLKVDVRNPETVVIVEIREKEAYVHTKEVRGALGMPVGSSGKAGLLLSGGIDSPVAGYMMAKRGLDVLNIHFESPPYTSERAKKKVLQLAKEMAPYTLQEKVLVVNLTKVQEEIKLRCKENLFTVIMRRYMMKIANKLAERFGLEALITGESLAQVASQTMQAIACTQQASGLPILRPLIGLDKVEIIETAKKIGTYETSILPYEDCCTVFTPRHPMTKPKLEMILEEEAHLEEASLIEEAAASAELVDLAQFLA